MNMTHKFGKKFSLTGSVNYNLNRNGNLFFHLSGTVFAGR